MITVIAVDGYHLLNLPNNAKSTLFFSSIVSTLENIDDATVILGKNIGTYEAPVFLAFPNGTLNAIGGAAAVNHGHSVALMVSISGITSNLVKVEVIY